MIGLKLFVLGTIARNFVLYHCVKEIKIFEQHRNFIGTIWEIYYAPNYIKLQLNMKLHLKVIHFRALVLEIQCPQNFGDMDLDLKSEKVLFLGQIFKMNVLIN